MMFDYIVIGAGYGGLAAAALLQKRGHTVLLLEGHATLGGCASFFRRKGFTFDVGATTLSGLLPGQPLGNLFAALNLQPEVVKLDPGMVIQLDGRRITRHAGLKRWVAEAESHFPHTRQREFWQKIYSLNEAAWPAVNASPRFPPASLSDVFALARPANLRHAPLLPGLFRPLTVLLDEYGLNDAAFRRFLDEQLLISTQNTAENVPYLTAAMGLAYPSETYYPTGGMYRPALLLLREFRRLGGVAHFNQRVTQIEKRPNGYAVITLRGENWMTRGLVSNVPLWNMGEITRNDVRDYCQQLAARYDWAWGAFTTYFAVPDAADLPTAYHQIHLPEPLPHCHSRSMFVSFSLRGDKLKAKPGWRTVTISTHTRAENWHGLSAEQYASQKEAAQRAALQAFDRAFPEFAGAEKDFVASGTPRTFEHYTSRHLGFVGGIPHSLRNNPLRLAPNATPFRDFYMVGDSVFPGQGTPAVVLGALNVAARIGYARNKELHE